MSRSDANKGLLLFNNKKLGFYTKPEGKSIIGIKGDLRRSCFIGDSLNKTLVITRSNETPILFKIR